MLIRHEDFLKPLVENEPYSFYVDGIKDTRLAEKIAAWDTAGLYGTEWRVIAMEISRPLEQPAAAAAPEKK
ncbi:MAG: hypothetical protein Q8R14_02420 [Candidatus Omnitrophota bacterium]|nr:hypothetical protein [Candidatus Omnitrophota bacterium]